MFIEPDHPPTHPNPTSQRQTTFPPAEHSSDSGDDYASPSNEVDEDDEEEEEDEEPTIPVENLTQSGRHAAALVQVLERDFLNAESKGELATVLATINDARAGAKHVTGRFASPSLSPSTVSWVGSVDP